MVNRMLVITCIILTFLIYDKIEAATILYDGTNVATGIVGLKVGSNYWDVDFKYGNFDEFYTSGLDFVTETSARDAAQEVSTLFSDPLTVTSVKDEIENHSTTNFYIPYSDDPVLTQKYFAIKSNYSSSTWEVLSDHANPNDNAQKMFAKFTAVPIPAAFWLLGSGLIGIVGIRSKFKN